MLSKPPNFQRTNVKCCGTCKHWGVTDYDCNIGCLEHGEHDKWGVTEYWNANSICDDYEEITEAKTLDKEK